MQGCIVLGDDCPQGTVILCDVTLILVTEIVGIIGNRTTKYLNSKLLLLNLGQRCRLSPLCSCDLCSCGLWRSAGLYYQLALCNNPEEQKYQQLNR
jgi:hypothetical protein